MMKALTQDFYNVMYKYQKPFAPTGVLANLNEWKKNKGALTDLLRRHPSWNEQELAIIFDLSVGRDIDRNIVDECKFTFCELVDELQLTSEQRADFDFILSCATADYSKVPSDGQIERIRNRGIIKCASGQKTSRILSRLCTHFGIQRHEGYNAAFARLADAFNPLLVQKTGVLSVNPCDFLEMSNKDNSWDSCHRLNGGGYQAGCLSYLADSVSMIFFTVDDDVQAEFHKHPKRSRQMFFYADNLLLQSRLYPSDNHDDVTQLRGLVQKAMATCISAPNLWTLKTNLDEISPYFDTVESSRHYRDYDYYARLSLLKGAPAHGNMNIGHASICVCCGGQFSSHSRIKCNCLDMVVCADCGNVVPANNARYMEGVYSCNACLHICTACGQTVRTDMYPAFDRHGHLIEVCTDCYQTMTSACGACRVHAICNMLSGARFCQKTALTAVAA